MMSGRPLPGGACFTVQPAGTRTGGAGRVPTPYDFGPETGPTSTAVRLTGPAFAWRRTAAGEAVRAATAEPAIASAISAASKNGELRALRVIPNLLVGGLMTCRDTRKPGRRRARNDLNYDHFA